MYDRNKECLSQYQSSTRRVTVSISLSLVQYMHLSSMVVLGQHCLHTPRERQSSRRTGGRKRSKGKESRCKTCDSSAGPLILLPQPARVERLSRGVCEQTHFLGWVASSLCVRGRKGL
jgi:hypothetical protein